MKKALFFMALAAFLLAPFESSEAAKRKRRKKPIRTWSVSVSSGYNLFKRLSNKAQRPDASKSSQWISSSPETNIRRDGQMHKFFSSLDLARNFGHYELGAKIQFTGEAFVSPFIKWNMTKNRYKTAILPSLTFGVAPSHQFGAYLRLSLGLALNRRAMIHPFLGCYGWFKATKEVISEKWGLYANAGLSLSLFL